MGNGQGFHKLAVGHNNDRSPLLGEDEHDRAGFLLSAAVTDQEAIFIYFFDAEAESVAGC